MVDEQHISLRLLCCATLLWQICRVRNRNITVTLPSFIHNGLTSRSSSMFLLVYVPQERFAPLDSRDHGLDYWTQKNVNKKLTCPATI